MVDATQRIFFSYTEDGFLEFEYHEPLIVVSGIAGRHLAVRQPVAVFDKPIDPDKFLDAVRKALGQGE